jgi:hypothetical protein
MPKQARTTHSDLARELQRIAKALESIPAQYIAADATTRKFIADAADALIALDNAVDTATVCIRDAREALRGVEAPATKES